jgi:tRNA (cytidine32/uridine32-2'-O)-methyltransferase
MIQPVPLSAIRIVLVEPSHPGNIGAVARAMKNMALTDLVLVRPKAHPDPEATARASSAADVLDRARVVETVADAVADCGFVAATTSRSRDHNFRALDLHEAAQDIFTRSARAPAAVLFGAERTGLTNEELALAHLLIRIPANPVYPSLNLAMAVQLACYELFRAAGSPADSRPLSEPTVPLAVGADMERFYEHLQVVMDDAEFHDRTPGGTHLMTRIRRLFQRCEMDQNEVNILRGILTAVQNKRRSAGRS